MVGTAPLRRHRPYAGGNNRDATSDPARCAAARGADSGGSATCHARSPCHERRMPLNRLNADPSFPFVFPKKFAMLANHVLANAR